MKTIIGIQQHFDAAHWLVDTETKCDAIHGHRWLVEVRISSEKLNKNSMVVNFVLVKKWINEIIDEFDHNILNRFLDQPTAENLSKYLFQKINIKLHNQRGYYKLKTLKLESVRVYETTNSFAEYTYNDFKEDNKERIVKMRKKEWEDTEKSKIRIQNIKNTISSNPEELRRRSERMIGENNPMKNRIFVEKMMKALQKTLKIKPNKHEQKLLELFKENNIPLDFVGDGKVIINGKCPDFINKEQKFIVEYWHSFWHSNNNPWYKVKDDRKERTEFFNKEGYKVVYLNEKDLEKGIKHIKNLLIQGGFRC